LGFGLRLELGKISFHLVNLVVDIFLAQVEVVDLKSGEGANQDEANVEPLALGGPYDSAVCDSKEAAYAPEHHLRLVLGSDTLLRLVHK
jgi:hypothetical protein